MRTSCCSAPISSDLVRTMDFDRGASRRGGRSRWAGLYGVCDTRRPNVSSYKWFQLVTLLVLATVFLLATAARRYPHVTWLRGFANAFPRLPEAQRRQAAKRADFYAGAELIVAGLVLPLTYAALT